MRMKNKSVHEPEAKVMNASEVWDDAQQITDVLRQNLLKTEPVGQLRIPFIGIWQDREDLVDSISWVRDIRRREWKD